MVLFLDWLWVMWPTLVAVPLMVYFGRNKHGRTH